jgi:hypothetical protein
MHTYTQRLAHATRRQPSSTSPHISSLTLDIYLARPTRPSSQLSSASHVSRSGREKRPPPGEETRSRATLSKSLLQPISNKDGRVFLYIYILYREKRLARERLSRSLSSRPPLIEMDVCVYIHREKGLARERLPRSLSSRPSLLSRPAAPSLARRAITRGSLFFAPRTARRWLLWTDRGAAPCT